MEHWILLRGLARHSGHWVDFPGELEKARHAEVHLIDLPGFGKSWQEVCPSNMDQVIENLNRKVGFLKGESFNVLGISLGGMVAMRWIETCSQINKAIIINSSLRGINRSFDRMQKKAGLKLLACMLLKDIREREKLILSLNSNKYAGSEKVLNQWVQASLDYPISKKNIMRQLLWSMQAKLPHARNEDMLFLCSGNDQICNPKCSQQIAIKLDAQLKTHANAGHDLCLDDPKWLIQMIDEWMS